MLLDAGTTGHCPGLAPSEGNIPCALFSYADTTDDTRDATGCKHTRTFPWAGIIAGKQCHARRFDIADTADDTRDATGCRHNPELP